MWGVSTLPVSSPDRIPSSPSTHRRTLVRQVLLAAASLTGLLAVIAITYLVITANQYRRAFQDVQATASALNDALQRVENAAPTSATQIPASPPSNPADPENDSHSPVSIAQQAALRLALQSIQLAEEHPDLALLLGVEADRLKPSAETRSALLYSLASHPGFSRYLWGHPGFVNRVVVSPDGSLAASGGEDGSIRLWDLNSLSPLGAPLLGHTGAVLDLSFSPDGSLLASASADRLVVLWDLAAGKPLGAPLLGHSDEVTALRFSPDGEALVTGGRDGTLVFWDTASRAMLADPIPAHPGGVLALAYSPDGRLLASAGEDSAVRLWEAGIRRPSGAPLERHTEKVFALAFSPDGVLLASGGRDGQVILWDVPARRESPPAISTTAPVLSLAFSPGGETLLTASEDQVSSWDVSARQLIPPIYRAQSDPLTSLALAPGGQSLLTSGYQALLVWDLDPLLHTIARRSHHSAQPAGLAFSPDGARLAVGGDDLALSLWDAQLHRQVMTFDSDGNQLPYSPVFSRDGELIYAGGYQGVYAWDVESGRLLPQRLDGPLDWVVKLSYAPEANKMAAVSGAGEIFVWDLATSQRTQIVQENISPLATTAALSPDGTTLVAGREDGTLRLWDASAPEEPVTLAGHSGQVLSTAFSPDGELLASGGADGTVILWDMASLTPLEPVLRGHSNWVSSLAFHPSGRMHAGGGILASGGLDKQVILWDVASRQMIGRPLTGHGGRVLSLAFSPDGALLASGSQDGSIIFWETDPATWSERACQVAQRDLTPAEWELYLAGSEYRESCK